MDRPKSARRRTCGAAILLDVQEAIRSELGDDKIRVLQIGIAGENLVRYAGITNDLRHFNGRNGMGAVMGSKNLRAVAVRGSQRYQTLAHDPEALHGAGPQTGKRCARKPLKLGLAAARHAGPG